MTLCSEVLGTVTREAFEIKDVLEVGRWLQQKGFSDVIDSFEGEFDFPFFACVNSIFYRPRNGWTGNLSFSSWDRDVLPKYGQRIKVL